MKKLMKTIIENIGLFVFLILGIPAIIVLCFTIASCIPEIDINSLGFDNKTWLTFWGSYLGGVATVIAITVSYNQTKVIIIRERKEKYIENTKREIDSLIDLINDVDIDKQVNILLFDTYNLENMANIFNSLLNFESKLSKIGNRLKTFFVNDKHEEIIALIEEYHEKITEEHKEIKLSLRDMTYNLSNKEKLQGTKKRIYIAYDKSRKQREEFRDKINEIIQLISNEMEMEINK